VNVLIEGKNMFSLLLKIVALFVMGYLVIQIFIGVTFFLGVCVMGVGPCLIPTAMVVTAIIIVIILARS
jgi:hypothetical protein